jgi:signal transduction protein with GAF and PtsI domain
MNIRTYTNSTQHLPTDLNHELLRLSTKLEDATEDLEKYSRDFAANEHAYRQAKALAYIKFQNDPGGGRRTVEMIKAVVDRECERERLDA